MAAPADYRPELADIAKLLPARTLDQNGDELGTFTSDTRPTAVDVEEHIDASLDLLTPRLGDVSDRLLGMAKRIVTLRVGMFIERPSFRDANNDSGTYETLRDEYREALADYDTALGDATPSVRSKIASVSMSYLGS